MTDFSFSEAILVSICEASLTLLSCLAARMALFKCSSPAASASYTSANNTILYQAISQSATYPASSTVLTGSAFQLNSQETVSSDYVFVRVNNAEYNYSTNPTFVSGSTGAVLYQTMIYSPQTFVTTVGLYNNNSELLAVAKLSQALVKDFTKEALIRVKLDW